MISEFPYNPTLTTAFEQRFNSLTIDTSALLMNCAGLKEFLPRAIEFLTRNNNENQRCAENIAHYLMGDVDYLPEGLAAPASEIPVMVKTELYDLLRTNRYSNCFGEMETSEKTIAKLTALSAYQYEHQLQGWLNAAPTEKERAARQFAIDAILMATNSNSKELFLADLELTTIPPLPSDLRSLDLSGNRFTSLVGLPRQMNALEELRLGFNRLVSLAGLPEQMNALKTLNLTYNQLASLAGMPRQMNELEVLDLGFNQLVSLAGIPQQMNALRVLDLRYNRLTSLSGIPQQITQQDTTAIFLAFNPLSPDTIAAITNGAYQATIHFDMAAHDTGSRAVMPLDEEVKAWFPGMDTGPWKAYAESVDGKALATLLMRLHGCASFDGAGRQDSVKELDAILQRMLKDAAFRTYCLTAVQGSDANCHDNVQAIFDELRMHLANPTTKDGATLGQVAEFQKGRLAARLIDEYVTTLGAGGDPLESGMLLKKELTQELALPIPFKEIKYGTVGVVSNDIAWHKARARDYVVVRLTPARLAEEMAADPTCAGFLKKSYQVTFAAHNLLWQDALENAKGGTVQGIDHTESKLETARKMAFGDGKQYMALQQQEEQTLLKKVALNAQSSLTMSADERAHWEVKELAQQPDWLAYLNRFFKVKPAEEPQQDRAAQTRDVLWKEAGIQFDSKAG